MVSEDRVEFHYTYTLSIPLGDVADEELVNNNYIFLLLACRDKTTCFSNYTDDLGEYTVMDDDIKITYNTYFFDSIREVYRQVVNRNQVLTLNTTTLHEFTLFSLSSSNDIWGSPFGEEKYHTEHYYNFDMGKFEVTKEVTV